MTTRGSVLEAMVRSVKEKQKRKEEGEEEREKRDERGEKNWELIREREKGGKVWK